MSTVGPGCSPPAAGSRSDTEAAAEAVPAPFTHVGENDVST